MAEEKTQEKNEGGSRGKRVLSGVVVSNKMQDTVVVAVSRYVKHPKYRKFIKRVKKHHADDKGNTKQVGEKVLIEECRPLSKTKHFRVLP